jgi:hypothetical protein
MNTITAFPPSASNYKWEVYPDHRIHSGIVVPPVADQRQELRWKSVCTLIDLLSFRPHNISDSLPRFWWLFPIGVTEDYC